WGSRYFPGFEPGQLCRASALGGRQLLLYKRSRLAAKPGRVSVTAWTLVIGNKNYSSWSLRPWLALKAAGQDFEEILIPLRQPATKASILAHSPAGKVPVLKHGDLLVWESLSICE